MTGEPSVAEDWEGRYREAAAELEQLYQLQSELSVELQALRLELERYKANRLLTAIKNASRPIVRLLPPGSRRRWLAGRLFHLVIRAPRPEIQMRQVYLAWLDERRPGPEELELQRKQSAQWEDRPLISVCMPVYNPEPAALRQAIASVEAQSYEHWELCLCDDGSTGAGVRRVLEEAAAGDPRVKVTFAQSNGGISSATNAALATASGEFVAFMDDDDLVEPHTLFLYAQQLRSRPDADVVYCDEDMLMPSGQRRYPFFKPSWSPDTLLGMNYITHLVLARRTLVDEVGGLRPERDGAQDHDLLLRLAERTERFVHVPEVLYSWRQSPRSTAMTSEAKPYAYEAGRQAVQDALDRRGTPGRVEHGSFPGAFRVRYTLPDPPPRVEIIIPTRDRAELLATCLESIRSLTEYPNYTVTVLDNDSVEQSTKDLFARSGVRVVPAPGPFNYAKIMNIGFRAADAEYVLTLNNDTRITDPEWLRGLVELAAQPGVGMSGCRLDYEDGLVQHEGIALACGVPAANLGLGAPGIRVLGPLKSTRDVSAVTGACCVIRRSAWEAVGGYDEAFAVAYNDVDFCIRLRHAGYRIVYTPYVSVVHAESASRGDLHPAEDVALFLRRWGPELLAGDPYFPAQLTIEWFGLAIDKDGRGFQGKELAEISLRHAQREADRRAGAASGPPPGTGPV
jgi:GT2 family glycosyltransferase